MKYILLALTGLLLSSCLKYQDIEIKGIEKVQTPRFENKELLIDIDVRINNVNPYKIKVKPSELQVYIDNDFIGTVFLDEKVVIRRKAENTYTAKLRGKMADGMLMTMMRVALKSQVTLQLKGELKGAVYGFPSKLDVDQQRVIETAQLKGLIKGLL